jgi:hypothetical protein
MSTLQDIICVPHAIVSSIEDALQLPTELRCIERYLFNATHAGRKVRQRLNLRLSLTYWYKGHGHQLMSPRSRTSKKRSVPSPCTMTGLQQTLAFSTAIRSPLRAVELTRRLPHPRQSVDTHSDTVSSASCGGT